MKFSPSVFCSYEFDSEAEEMTAQLLTPTNKAWLQNMASKYAAEKLTLNFDPDRPLEFAQREAELKGQILLLQHLLDCAIAAETYFAEQQRSQEQSNIHR